MIRSVEPSTSATPASVILRPSWLSAIHVGPTVALVIVPFAWLLGNSLLWPLVYAAVFGFVFVVIDHRRWAELTPTAAVTHVLWQHRSIDRTEVRGVVKGQVWSGGIRLLTDHRDFQLRVADRPFGQVSDALLGVVTTWADATPSQPR